VEGKSHQLPKPANVGGVYMPAPLEAPLRGMPEWPGPPLEHEPEVFEAEVSEEFGALLSRAQALVEGDERVREHFGERRYEWLGASVLDPKGEHPASVLVVAFDYERNVAVEVELHGEGDALRVIDVNEAAYHPAPSDGEVDRAIGLAREDRRVAGHLAEELEASALLVSDVEQGDRHYGTRRIEIDFCDPEERLPRVRAIVDLARERVLGVHVDSGHHHANGEDR
jgi:hypothetical protein